MLNCGWRLNFFFFVGKHFSTCALSFTEQLLICTEHTRNCKPGENTSREVFRCYFFKTKLVATLSWGAPVPVWTGPVHPGELWLLFNWSPILRSFTNRGSFQCVKTIVTGRTTIVFFNRPSSSVTRASVTYRALQYRDYRTAANDAGGVWVCPCGWFRWSIKWMIMTEYSNTTVFRNFSNNSNPIKSDYSDRLRKNAIPKFCGNSIILVCSFRTTVQKIRQLVVPRSHFKNIKIKIVKSWTEPRGA